MLRDYSRFFLKANPFPRVPIPDEEPKIYVGQEHVIKGLLDTCLYVYKTNMSDHAVVIGPYGSGKTHTLLYMRARLKEMFKNGTYKPIIVYVSNPGHSFVNIYSAIMKEFLIQVRKSALSRIVMKIKELPLGRALKVYLKGDAELRDYAYRWIVGERLTYAERKKLKIGNNVDDNLAIENLKYLAKYCNEFKIGPFFVFIDELESISELNALKRQAMLNSLRRLIDVFSRNLCLILACTPAGWDAILNYSLPLARRLSRNIVYLEKLKKNDVLKVIASYIKPYRINEDKLREFIKKKKGIKRNFKQYIAIYPFDIDATYTLHEISNGNIGELLKYASLLIDKALDQNLDFINSELVRKLL